MKTEIKRLAQFLFDNAGAIEDFLTQSDHYRSLGVELRLFRPIEKLQTSLSLYDATTTHHYLENNHINIERFKEACGIVDLEAGVNLNPEPEKVRDKL